MSIERKKKILEYCLKARDILDGVIFMLRMQIAGMLLGPPDCTVECQVVDDLEEEKEVVCLALGFSEKEKAECLQGRLTHTADDGT